MAPGSPVRGCATNGITAASAKRAIAAVIRLARWVRSVAARRRSARTPASLRSGGAAAMVLGQRDHERQQREPAEGRAGRHEVAVCLMERRVGGGALVSPVSGVAQLGHARTKAE